MIVIGHRTAMLASRLRALKSPPPVKRGSGRGSELRDGGRERSVTDV